MTLEDFSRAVGAIYDAAVEATLWTPALEAICAFVGTRTSALGSYDIFDRTPPWQFDVGYAPEWLQIYFEKYYALNPYMDDVARLDPGEAFFSSSRADYAQLLTSDFYDGWLKPQGLLDGGVLVVEKSMSHITTLVGVRDEHQGAFDKAAMARFRLLYPHLRRAVLIGRTFKAQRERLAADAAILDSLGGGMFLLGSRGEFLQANAAGQTMLAARSQLKVANGRLELSTPWADRALHEALASARRGDLGLEGRGASIPVWSGDDTGGEVILHLLPLNAVRQRAIDAGSGAAFVLFARRIDRGDTAAVAAFAARFGLTPKEAEVLQTVVEVGGVPQAADVMGLSTATVRSHVTAIFDKSGVRRQADLIRLLMEMKSPFVS